MKKATILFFMILIYTNSFSQVGIGTTNPNATLQVDGQPSDTGVADGIIAPRISRADLISKTSYSTNQIGAIVYVTDLSGTVNSTTQKITEIGYYSFNGTNWNSMNSSKSNIGDTKQGFQAADHSGWIKLDGRVIATLTTTQQAQATTLGFATNLPNSDGAKAVQNGGTLGAVTGSNMITLLRSNLPNVTLYFTTNTAGYGAGAANPAKPRMDGNGPAHDWNINGYTESINGGVTQTQVNISGKEISVNMFVYLGE